MGGGGGGVGGGRKKVWLARVGGGRKKLDVLLRQDSLFPLENYALPCMVYVCMCVCMFRYVFTVRTGKKYAMYSLYALVRSMLCIHCMHR